MVGLGGICVGESGISVPLLMIVARAVLRGENCPKLQFCQKTACSSYVQPWLVAICGWRLAVGGDWWFAVGGGWRQLVVGNW